MILIDSDFNWDQCLGEDRVTKSWISASIGLAKELLGADVSAAPADLDLTVPGWLKETVLKEWCNPYPDRFMHSRLLETIRTPRLFWHEFKKRWPNPLVAATRLNTPITDRTLFEHQASYFVTIPFRFLRRTGEVRKSTY